MTAPLVPEEVDLRGLPWMRLDTSRLLDSDLFALSTGDEFKAAVALWCKSWGQAPAGSLPKDDRILAHLSGAGSKWKRVREMALRGWMECSDGRLYHAVVAEQALAAWEERQAFREKIEGQNTRQQKLRAERATLMADLKAAGEHLAWNAPIAEVRARHAKLPRPVTPPKTVRSRTCHSDSHGLDGTGRDGNITTLGTSSASVEILEGASAMARALQGIGYSECSERHPHLVEAAAAGVTVDEIRAAADKPGKPIGYIVARAMGRRRDAAEQAQGSGPPPAPPPVDPAEQERRARREEVERQIYDIRHRHSHLGEITADERDQQIRELLASAEGASAGALS